MRPVESFDQFQFDEIPLSAGYSFGTVEHSQKRNKYVWINFTNTS